MSPEEGRLAVALARESIERSVSKRIIPLRNLEFGPFLQRRGVFVTLNSASKVGNNLRGCVGFPYPIKRLSDAIQEAAVAAASEDPRFPPVGEEELDSILVEVSILTPPQDLTVPRLEIPSHLRVGHDGLIISNSYTSGLLLPQVATEFGMDQAEFLSQACMKAGLPPDAWLDPTTRIQIFQAEIFSEKKPGGEVAKVATDRSLDQHRPASTD